MTDVLTELGELALASRLRRLSDALMEDAAGLYADLGLEFQPHWFGLFYFLGRRSPVAVTEAAQSLGLSHTAVRQIATRMIRAGFVRESADRADTRRRLLSLTSKGRRQLAALEPVWAEFRRAARDLLAQAGVDLIRHLDRIEEAHRDRSIVDRVRARLELPARRRLVIEEYRPAYKKRFRALNEEWLRRNFSLEQHDQRLLDEPKREIIARGGRILFALFDGEVVCTCALMRHPDGSLELAKMAVAPAHRKQGIGTALARAVIERAGEIGSGDLYLRTSPRLRAALRLYRRLGFRKVPGSPLPGPQYSRETITMRLEQGRLPRD